MMSILKKSQIGVEFMIFSGIALITAIIFVSISFSQTKDLYDTKEFLLVKDIALKIDKEIDITSYVEDGYNRKFDIPEMINNGDYNISIVNNTLTVWTNTTQYVTRILNITGYVERGSNTITKTNGIIYLN